MLKSITKTILAAAGLLVATATANAAVNVSIEQNGFGSGPIEVISENGTSWTKILPADLTLPVKVAMGITSGELRSYEIRQGGETIHYAGEFLDGPNPHQATHTVTGSTEHFIFETQAIIGACNERLGEGDGIHQEHTFWHGVQLELVARFDMNNGDAYPPYSGYGEVSVPVKCKRVIETPDTVANDPGEMLIKDAKLFLTTISTGQNTGHTLGGCKTLKTSVRFETNQLGPVSFELHRFPGGMTNHTVDAEFEPATGKYFARYVKYETFQSTTSVQYMAKSTSPSAGMTGWKDITIHCGGGLSQNPNPNNPDNDIPQGSTLTGDFGFVDHGSPKCPRQAKALVTFKSPKSDNIHWSLDCKFSSKSGVLAAQPNPQGGYMAVTLVPIDVETTMNETCTLKTLAPYAPKEHVSRDRLFQCVTPTMPPATTDLTPQTRPDHSEPRGSGKVVINPPRPGGRNSGKADISSGKTRADAEADRRRLEALKKAQEAKKRADAARKAAAAAAEAKRKAAAEAQRKRDAATAARKAKAQAEAARKARALKLRLEAARTAKIRRKPAAKRRTTTPMLLHRRR